MLNSVGRVLPLCGNSKNLAGLASATFGSFTENIRQY